MINPELLSTGFEDIICEATEELSGPEIYAALNKAINSQMDWHKKELKALQEFQWLVTGAAPKDPSDQP
ncbi:MAG: hypothetical protein GY920_08425 [Aliivibrio sp.]|jgi:hypothetical protein|nr:hypothetical protein [Aliivibrio sp.]